MIKYIEIVCFSKIYIFQYNLYSLATNCVSFLSEKGLSCRADLTYVKKKTSNLQNAEYKHRLSVIYVHAGVICNRRNIDAHQDLNLRLLI